MGDFIAPVVPVALFLENLFTLFHGIIAGDIQFKLLSNHGSFSFIDGQPPLIFDVVENPIVVEYNTILDDLMANLDAAG